MYRPVIDPDCRDGKHGACPEWTWDDQHDKSARCQCTCHRDQHRERSNHA